jgi:hypothetical protein
MSPNESELERLSFWELLKRFPVEIPVIQRDYAQGREGNEKVIDSFLKALKDAVAGMPIELDFIFGDSKGGTFRPLDGQQRLTTLFLLHWYAARTAGFGVETYALQLGRFFYETRVSSRDFCRKLVNAAVNVGDASGTDTLSQRIRDYPWFVSAWEFDPTVAGMLAVLDKITAIAWPGDMWTQLTAIEPSPIRFSLVELENFGLSDDLYIKMNARGKALTPFENFKAMLGARVVEQGWDADSDLRRHFATLVDNRWTDFFWQFCPEQESGLKQIDGTFLSFIVHSLVCSMARDTSSAKKIADRMQDLLNNPETLEANEFTSTYYLELRERLELICDMPNSLNGEVRAHWEIADESLAPQESIVEEVLRETGPQYKRRLILYAQMKLHESAVGVSEENIADWRRVVRNVIAHSVVERPENFVGGIRLLDELAKGVRSIYEHLATATVESGFARVQVQEEQRKARLLVRYPAQKDLLHRLEDTNFLRGRISFALDCVNEQPEPQNFDFALLEEVASVIETEFGRDITNQIRRAFLTIGDGGFFRYWSSWFYTKDLPKYCLIYDYRDFRSFTGQEHLSRNTLRAFVLALVVKSCDKLIAEYQPAPGTPNWRTRLICEEDLIRRATHHYIALDEANGIVYPINGQRPRNNAATQDYLEENKFQ